MKELEQPLMSGAEIAFLERSLKPNDRVWEWGSGDSTLWLARRVRHVTSVEHQRGFAQSLLEGLEGSTADVSLLFVPTNAPYTEGTDDDGDAQTFRDYVGCYSGRSVDVVIIDGRARVSCARWVAECAQFGPTPMMRFFLHDCQREQYRAIWEVHLKEVERVDNLMLLRMRMPGE